MGIKVRSGGQWVEVGGGSGAGGGSGVPASAWAAVESDGSVESGASFNCTITKPVGTGRYDVTFTNPMPSGEYSVTTAPAGTTNIVRYQDRTANGFSITCRNTSDSAIDTAHSFVVHATNSPELTGGTGADAWIRHTTSSGTLGSFNISGVTTSGSANNNFTCTFTNSMPDANYAVVVTPNTTSDGVCFASNQTTTSFDVITRDFDGTDKALGFGAVVHATNANLPNSFTEEEIQSVVDLAQSDQFLRSDIADTHSGTGGLTFNDGLLIDGGPGTIGGSTFDNGWLRIGDSTLGITMDNNELYFAGLGIIGALSGGSITFTYGARFNAGIRDGGNSLGSSGQILSSTSTGIDWVNPSDLSVDDANTLAGLGSTQFLRSDVDDTATGQITINNGTAGPLVLERSGQLGIEFSDTSTSSRFLGVSGGNLFYGSSSNHGTNNKIWHEGNDGSGSGLDADTLDDYEADTAVTNSTVAVRTGNGDLQCRLVRQTFADQNSISGGMVFRVNNSNDNYLRICNDTAAIRDYLEINANSSTLSSAQSASGAGTVTFNDVPSGIKRITVMFRDLSLSGGNDIRIQLGTSSGWVTSGYSSLSSGESGNTDVTATNGFIIRCGDAGNVAFGQMIITKFNSTAWVETGQFKMSGSTSSQCYGDVGSTGGTITRVRIQTDGTNTFDGGNINCLYG